MEQIDDIEAFVHDFIARAYGVEFTEHRLIKALEQASLLPNAENAMHELFIRHFLVMHVLYRLQQAYESEQGGVLTITATFIRFDKWRETDSKSASIGGDSTKLRDYYLDLSNLAKEDSESVSELLDTFWRKYSQHVVVSTSEASAAAALLGLELPTDLAAARKRYKSMMQKHHPDAGGDADTCVQIQHAYEQVKHFLRA